MKIAMWSGPRNLSTALMYSFAARGDCAIMDEPFYAPYLAVSGKPHPMAAQITSAHETNPDRVAAHCNSPALEGGSIVYQKHMPHHMLADFDLSWMASCTNVFLIRHPARVIASYARKLEGPTMEDIGFAAQTALFEAEADRLGYAPTVIDSVDIRADPAAALSRLCTALGISFTDKMLHWPAGGHPSDGIWASHWYGAVHRSTGFEDPEGPLPTLTGDYARLQDAALPHYEALARYKI